MYIHLHTIGLIGMTELGTATFHFAPNRRWFHWSISQWILLRRKKSFRQKLKGELKFISAIFTFDKNMKSCIFAHSGITSLVYLFVCMYISYKAHNQCTKETFLIGSDVDVNIFTRITVITCSGYLGKYPCSLLTWIWKVSYLPILLLFHWCICSYVYHL